MDANWTEADTKKALADLRKAVVWARTDVGAAPPQKVIVPANGPSDAWLLENFGLRPENVVRFCPSVGYGEKSPTSPATPGIAPPPGS